MNSSTAGGADMSGDRSVQLHSLRLRHTAQKILPGAWLAVALIVPANADSGRDFSALYDFGSAHPVDATHVSVQLYLALQNHGATAVSNATIFLGQPGLLETDSAQVAGGVAVAHRAVARVSGTLTIDTQDYQRWQRGQWTPLLLYASRMPKGARSTDRLSSCAGPDLEPGREQACGDPSLDSLRRGAYERGARTDHFNVCRRRRCNQLPCASVLRRSYRPSPSLRVAEFISATLPARKSAVYQLNPNTDALTLVAGNNTSGYSGDGGPATNAQMETICGIALDAAGDVYIADCGSEVIRRVDASTGTITTVAGNGSGGYTGDGGPATSAALNSPHGLVVDGAGNLYIADTLNSVIRRVAASTGVISTVAGNGTAGFSGNGTRAIKAELNEPEGVAVDAAGDIYIADTQNNVVRLATASNGIIAAFAGNKFAGYKGDGGPATAARLNLPEGVALDSAGDLYIADTFNSVIRVVNASTGIITTAAGDGTAGYSGDGGPATAASLDHPAEVAIDSAGNLYIPDQYNFFIRLVNSGGTISTIAGDTFSSYGGDGASATGAQMNEPMGAVAVDSSGNLIIPDSSNNVVRRVAASTGIISTIAGTGIVGYSGDGGAASSAQLNGPQGIALDAADDIYIADAGNNVVRRIDASTGIITTFAGSHTCGYAGDTGPATSAQLCFPAGLAFDAAGDLYIADTDSMDVRRVNASTGIITTVAGKGGMQGYSGDGGLATNAELSIPNSVAVDGAGNLYIADSYNYVIREVFAASGEIMTVAGDHTIGYSGDGGPEPPPRSTPHLASTSIVRATSTSPIPTTASSGLWMRRAGKSQPSPATESSVSRAMGARPPRPKWPIPGV